MLKKPFKIVITRPKEHADAFAHALLASGIIEDTNVLFLEPLLHIEQKAPHIPNPERYDAVIVTSRHAVPTLIQNRTLLDKNLYCVGHETAKILRKAGAARILAESSTAKELSNSFKATPNQCFLYCRGRNVSFDFGPGLQRLGCTLDEVVCYAAHAATQLSPSFTALLHDNTVHTLVMPFFSARTARICTSLLDALPVSSPVPEKKIHPLCIAPSVLECLCSRVFDKDKAVIAPTPDQRGMIEALRQVVSRGS